MFKFLILNLVCSYSFAGVLVKEISSPGRAASIQEISYVEKNVTKPLVVRDIPMFMGEQDFTSEEMYKETIYPNYSATFYVDKKNQNHEEFLGSEVRTLIKQGPDNNRIILTILGDGYTEAEREKFFEDAQFMVDDLFVGETFKSYIPFFNIYAVFTPSQDSGITDKTRKNTAFGLYRSPAGSKRAIMPGNTSALEKALKLAPANAHYPIVIANDNFYGGLGGRYAITSRSRVSGPIVLRHELGHNFSNVGEEYDGGQVYSGANFSRTGKEWAHWRKNPTNEKHEAKFIFGAYVWKELTKPFIQNFSTDDNSAFFGVEISSVGWEREGDVEILLDGSPLKLKGAYTKDRSFFSSEKFNLKAGKHQLIIRSNGNNPEHVLAFADGYGFPQNYDFDSGEIKAFNNFDESERMVGYRPTENTCLMRNMLSKVFCSVDQENIWLQFLMRVLLIDSLTKNTDGTVELKTIPFNDSNLEISWYESEKEIAEFRGKKVVPFRTGLKARTKLVTPEIRLKSEHSQDEKEVL